MTGAGRELLDLLASLQEMAIRGQVGQCDAAKTCTEIAKRMRDLHALVLDAIVEAHIAGQTARDGK